MNELVDLMNCMWKLEPVYATACLFKDILIDNHWYTLPPF